MEKNRFRYNSDIVQRNNVARERGAASAREFVRVVDTFNKVLEVKERIGMSLEEELAECGRKIKVNRDNLEILNKNIVIYEHNLEKISSDLESLKNDEETLKAEYESLLNGLGGQLNSGESEGTENSVDDEIANKQSREGLMQRRENDLQKLNESFNKREEELLSIEKLMRELIQARSEISIKMDTAVNKKNDLVSYEERLHEDIARFEKDLEDSLRQEEILLTEYFKLIEKVENCVDLSEEIDHVLFSSLAVSDTENPGNNDGN
jgi:chromosome segregation ATPase